MCRRCVVLEATRWSTLCGRSACSRCRLVVVLVVAFLPFHNFVVCCCCPSCFVLLWTSVDLETCYAVEGLVGRQWNRVLGNGRALGSSQGDDGSTFAYTLNYISFRNPQNWLYLKKMNVLLVHCHGKLLVRHSLHNETISLS
jgi:hypothetical protein